VSKQPIQADTELQFPGLHLSESQSVRVYSKSDQAQVRKGSELLRNWAGAERIDPYSMLAPAPQTRIITQSQSRPLRESLLLGFMVIGMMIVGAGFLYLATEGLLWLEGYFAINS
jgi:hypothetical protein